MSYDTQHVHLIRRESEARRNPFGYRLSVLFLGLLGYAFIFLSLSLAIVLVIAFGLLFYFLISDAAHNPGAAINSARFGIPLMVGLGAFIASVFRALWVRIDLPHGLPLERGEAVPLFQEIDRLREKIGVPQFHNVFLTDELNAGVVGRPRLGLFGWQEYSLFIGVPLMAMLSPDQFRSVLAHEMGHTAPAQGRFDGWVYRLWQTWIVLLKSLYYGGHRSSIVFLWFFSWYAPLFGKKTFVLRRLNETECDKIAAETVGARVTADALLTLALVERAFHEKAAGPPDRLTAQRWLNDAMNAPDDPRDDHPRLSARLRAIGQTAEAPAPQTESALNRYLGHRAATIAQSVGRRMGH